ASAPTVPPSRSSGRCRSSRTCRACSSIPGRWRRFSTPSQTAPRSPSPRRTSGRCACPPGRSKPHTVDARPIDASSPRFYVAPMTDTLMVSVSGVRGIVGKDLTDDVVGRWAQAFGTWIVAAGNGERRGSGATVVVGRDARTSGPAFARAAMAGLTAAGCDVVDVGLVPTPTVQLAVEHHGAVGGIAITASHNPIEWNALKFIGPDGIFLDGAGGRRVAELAGEDGGERGKTGKVTTDPGAVERHLGAVLKLPAVDVEAIRARK